jgi:hypothetical protein
LRRGVNAAVNRFCPGDIRINGESVHHK